MSQLKKFLDRHPMVVSRFHPGRFATVFGEAISVLFILFFLIFKRSARFKRNFRHNCMPVLGLA